MAQEDPFVKNPRLACIEEVIRILTIKKGFRCQGTDYQQPSSKWVQRDDLI